MKNKDRSVINRIKKALSIGNYSSVFYIALFLIEYLYLFFITVFFPKANIKKEPNFDYENYKNLLKNNINK